MNKLAHILRKRRGFSLIEVLMGLLILMIALAAAATLSINNAQITANNQFRAQAACLAEWKLEQLRNTTFANVVNGTDAATLAPDGSSPGIFTRSWTKADGVPTAGMKRVTITVNWNQVGGAKTYVMQGDIAP